MIASEDTSLCPQWRKAKERDSNSSPKRDKWLPRCDQKTGEKRSSKKWSKGSRDFIQYWGWNLTLLCCLCWISLVFSFCDIPCYFMLFPFFSCGCEGLAETKSFFLFGVSFLFEPFAMFSWPRRVAETWFTKPGLWVWFSLGEQQKISSRPPKFMAFHLLGSVLIQQVLILPLEVQDGVRVLVGLFFSCWCSTEQALRGPAAILFISRDTFSDSIANFFRACFPGWVHHALAFAIASELRRKHPFARNFRNENENLPSHSQNHSHSLAHSFATPSSQLFVWDLVPRIR